MCGFVVLNQDFKDCYVRGIKKLTVQPGSTLSAWLNLFTQRSNNNSESSTELYWNVICSVVNGIYNKHPYLINI